MTIRLVALMSLVLLISLAASAFVLNAYQKGVMEEVRQTASEVGRATLSTLEYRFPAGDASFSVPLPPASGQGQVAEPDRQLEIREFQADPGDDPSAPRVHRIGQASFGVMIVHQEIEDTAPPPSTQGCDDATPGCEDLHHILGVKAQVDGDLAELRQLHESFVIHLDRIRADSDPARGTFLRIPTFQTAANEAAGEDGPPAAEAANVGLFWEAPGSGDAAATRDIILPIATDQFDELYAKFRDRTLLMFAGVFLLGTVLSASLASRFTRPVRRLDAGIRRLSEGDLDVQVDAHGRDEVGRLGRAFNEMAQRLRLSRNRERELTRREKLSALGRLAAGVAHDVRNPLHSINLTLQHLQEAARPVEEERGREFDRSLGIIRSEIHRLDGLVTNFLRFARSDRRTRVQVDLPELLRETARLVGKEAERRQIELRIITDGEVRPFPADPESIRSSILNLVMNSFEAMEAGGSLTLQVRGEAGQVVLEVADTGCGIAPEDQERVFEFAYTTREEGHGLGLAMVHQVVVEDHGGHISLESRPGAGTRVRMAFPLAPSGAGA